MNKFFIKGLIIYIFLIFVLTGCGRDSVIRVSSTQEPQITDDGYYDSTQIFSGGSNLTQQNMADIQIENIDAETVKLTIAFMEGGSLALIDQSVSEALPNYYISHIEGVDRMVIRFSGVSNWTYRLYQDELDNPVISGILRQKLIGDDNLYLYVSTKDEYSYQVTENGNKLEITYKHIDVEEEVKYYITINAFYEYENGTFNEPGFYPCLSDNGSNGVMISKAFDTETLAYEYIEVHKESLEENADSKLYSVVALTNNELPNYSLQNELVELVEKPIGKKGEDLILGTPLIIDGRFLAWDKNSTDYVYAKPYIIQGAQESDVLTYEQIWQNRGEADSSILEYQFISLSSAEYSYDGKYVAFIDQSDKTRMIEIVNVETGKLYLPADDSFGMDTSSFIWSNTENKLYAITGEYDSKQLLCYDITDVNSIEVYAITEEEYDESILHFYDDYIYYIKRSDDGVSNEIYSTNVETGKTKYLVNGNSFALSSDGKSLLVNDLQQNDRSTFSLYIYDIESHCKTEIQSGDMVMDSTWSINDEKIYYTTYKTAGWEEEFPMQLFCYDVKTEKVTYIMDFITGTIYPDKSDDSVLIMALHQLQDRTVSITYRVK